MTTKARLTPNPTNLMIHGFCNPMLTRASSFEDKSQSATTPKDPEIPSRNIQISNGGTATEQLICPTQRPSKLKTIGQGKKPFVVPLHFRGDMEPPPPNPDCTILVESHAVDPSLYGRSSIDTETQWKIRYKAVAARKVHKVIRTTHTELPTVFLMELFFRLLISFIYAAIRQAFTFFNTCGAEWVFGGHVHDSSIGTSGGLLRPHTPLIATQDRKNGLPWQWLFYISRPIHKMRWRDGMAELQFRDKIIAFLQDGRTWQGIGVGPGSGPQSWGSGVRRLNNSLEGNRTASVPCPVTNGRLARAREMGLLHLKESPLTKAESLATFCSKQGFSALVSLFLGRLFHKFKVCAELRHQSALMVMKIWS
ncbi:uncharacterized protein CLUP02_07446 [Colletotrichum lupini]|uniref:Uncharacterized protein n=1 Tax=Colletotrichum lupini TaxID=145971 RepID=A0A9Q8SR91_9PEZI|nr:uncharacterized protein CLUP02_07446 [Colletotrichum lupini]UQC81960.1 hypothetical protein CLUP02_07446 [Colletotrichum lupini]